MHHQEERQRHNAGVAEARGSRADTPHQIVCWAGNSATRKANIWYKLSTKHSGGVNHMYYDGHVKFNIPNRVTACNMVPNATYLRTNPDNPCQPACTPAG